MYIRKYKLIAVNLNFSEIKSNIRSYAFKNKFFLIFIKHFTIRKRKKLGLTLKHENKNIYVTVKAFMAKLINIKQMQWREIAQDLRDMKCLIRQCKFVSLYSFSCKSLNRCFFYRILSNVFKDLGNIYFNLKLIISSKLYLKKIKSTFYS